MEWILMLKRCIGDYLGHLTFDIDEVSGNWEKIQDYCPSDETCRTLRGVRNDLYKNKITDEYEFVLNQKKLLSV